MATQRILPNKRILRYSYSERIMHWIAAFSFTYLLLTGLAFYSPRLYWIATIFGGGPTARAWHPWAGLIFTATLVWMLRTWKPDMMAAPSDAAWKKTMGHYLRNEDEQVAGVGRFNPGQKQWFWAMFWCGVALLFSGLLMWFTEYIPWSLRYLRYLAVLFHVGAGLVTIGLFIIHVYMGTAVVREGFTSVIRGEVSQEWAKTHHPLWLAEINSESATKK